MSIAAEESALSGQELFHKAVRTVERLRVLVEACDRRLERGKDTITLSGKTGALYVLAEVLEVLPPLMGELQLFEAFKEKYASRTLDAMTGDEEGGDCELPEAPAFTGHVTLLSSMVVKYEGSVVPVSMFLPFPDPVFPGRAVPEDQLRRSLRSREPCVIVADPDMDPHILAVICSESMLVVRGL